MAETENAAGKTTPPMEVANGKTRENPIVRVEMRQGWGDCDCCGAYSWQRATVTKDGEPILEHGGDTHMGGNEWNEWDDALRAILPALGFEVEIDDEYAA